MSSGLLISHLVPSPLPSETSKKRLHPQTCLPVIFITHHKSPNQKDSSSQCLPGAPNPKLQLVPALQPNASREGGLADLFPALLVESQSQHPFPRRASTPSGPSREAGMSWTVCTLVLGGRRCCSSWGVEQMYPNRWRPQLPRREKERLPRVCPQSPSLFTIKFCCGDSIIRLVETARGRIVWCSCILVYMAAAQNAL